MDSSDQYSTPVADPATTAPVTQRALTRIQAMFLDGHLLLIRIQIDPLHETNLVSRGREINANRISRISTKAPARPANQAATTSSRDTPRSAKTLRMVSSIRFAGHEAPAVTPTTTSPSPSNTSE